MSANKKGKNTANMWIARFIKKVLIFLIVNLIMIKKQLDIIVKAVFN